MIRQQGAKSRCFKIPVTEKDEGGRKLRREAVGHELFMPTGDNALQGSYQMTMY